MTFGEKLQALRKKHGWTQEELAAKITVSRQALSKWELGAAIPDTENVLQISKLFGVSTDYLLNDEYDSDNDIPAVQAKSEALTKRYSGMMYAIIGSIVSVIGAVGGFPKTSITPKKITEKVWDKMSQSWGGTFHSAAPLFAPAMRCES